MTIQIDHEPASETLTEGVFVAQPLCFPGQSVPPPSGETAINVMMIGEGQQVYCGTSGKLAHVLASRIHGESGAVRDAAVIPDATSVNGLAVNPQQDQAPQGNLYVIASASSGSALWLVHAGGPGGLIQEWSMVSTGPATKVCGLFDDAQVVHAVPTPDGTGMVGLTSDGRVFRLALGSPELRTVGQVEGPIAPLHRVACDKAGCVWGASANGELWVCDAAGERVECTGEHIPTEANGRPQTVTWALDEETGILYGGVDPDGLLFTLDPQRRALSTIGKVSRLEGIGCLVVAHDGRVFGTAGLDEDIGHLFCYDPKAQTLRNLSVAVSVLSVRQYGYVFRCAATGAGGEIYFGQHERVNHLWVYFPTISVSRT